MTAPLGYWDAVAALQARGRFGIRLGLARTRALLAAMGNPERGIRGALIGGTNGKGSVVALTGSCLRAAGYRTGETPKPHLVSYRERLRIAGRPIDPETFAGLVEAALPLADRVARRHGPPTEFELLTALAFGWFARQRIDVGLIEVGLGGRLDATHAWDGGVAAITNVDFDHTEWLGSTIEEIAREKAAILMRGDLAVTGATGAGFRRIAQRARRVRAPLVRVDPAPLLGLDRDGIVVDLPGLGAVRVGLLGRHQAANVAVADAVLDALNEAGIATVSADARRSGYAAARWPGRLEIVEVPGPAGARDALLDGAHNPAGARALAQALDDLRPTLAGDPGAPPTLVLAMMGDKDAGGILGPLAAAKSAAGARIIATQVEGPRALAAADLAAVWSAAADGVAGGGPFDRTASGRSVRGGSVRGRRPAPAVVPDLGDALGLALRTAEGPIVVAGSLYLVGAVRAMLVDDADLRDPVPSEPVRSTAGGAGSRPEAGSITTDG